MKHEPAQKYQPLLTPDEVASYLRLTRTQVIRQARVGRIPALKIGKAVRFQLSVIEKWAAQQTSSETSSETAA